MGNALIKQAGSGGTKIKFKNYGGPTLEKREVEGLSKGRSGTAATSNGNYALFGGGGGPFPLSEVEAYNVSLVRTIPADLTEAKVALATAKTGEYGLFAGGGDNFRNPYSSVDAYSASLSHSTATSLSESRTYLTGAATGVYSLFAGGNLTGSISSNKVDVYDDNLAQTTATTLSLERASLVATTVGEHAIFASGVKWTGDSGNGTNKVDAYSGNLVHSTLADATRYSYDAATAVGDYALFGESSGTLVDVYNSSLIKLTPVNLSDTKSNFAATTVGNFALFGGGRSSSEQFSKVEGFDNNLVLHQFEDLSEARSPLAATTVSNYALFGGGYSSTYSATVDCYEYVEKDLELTLLKGAKYKFQNMSNEITVTEDLSTISIPTPVTGYVKFKNANL